MTRNVPASVHQRLLNYARVEGRPFNEVLLHFALERFLYRLGRSSYHRQFVLKGALMFTVWQSRSLRPTRDIDLLGRLEDTVEGIEAAIQAICQESVLEDGMRFDAKSVASERIIETGQYQGVRVRFVAYLDTARIPMLIDVGFGDALVPGPVLVHLPTILDFPSPEVQGYTRESTVAEKFQAMVHLGEVNSREADEFYHFLLDLEKDAKAHISLFSSPITQQLDQMRLSLMRARESFSYADNEYRFLASSFPISLMAKILENERRGLLR